MTNTNTTFKTLAVPYPVVRETAKAILVAVDSKFDYYADDFVNVEVWIPKSQATVENNILVAAAGWIIREKGLLSQESADRATAKRDAAFAKYDALVAWAKEAGLPVRNRMKKATIVNIARNAGFEVPAQLI